MAFNKKIAIIGLSSVLLVAMVIGVIITDVKNKNDAARKAQKGQIAENMRAVKSICQPTPYKDTCEKSLMLAANHTTDSKELIKAGFNAAVKHIRDSIHKSTTLQAASTDPRTAGAYKVCEKVLDLAVDDLVRSFNKIDDFDLDHLEDHLFDLKVWLSAASTAQGTCLDAFEKTEGDAGEKMKRLLKLSRELTINGFAMVDELTDVLAEMNFTGTLNRKLLAEIPSAGQYPSWVKEKKRNLLRGDTAKKQANVVVAQDGSGKYRTINEAIVDIPRESQKPFIIYIKAGVYQEYVRLEKYMTNVMLVGDGPTNTKITGNRSEKKGFSTLDSATVGALGFNFIAKDIAFENTAAPDEGPAVALHIASDKSIVYHCQIDGYQDTLFSHDHRQFFRDCIISGTIDFIFGDAIVVFQNCKIIARKPAPSQSNMITAQGREFVDDITGIVIQNCTISPDPELAASPTVQSYLGRPWKTYSKTIIMDSFIDGFINPAGWSIWEDKNPNNVTSYIVEYDNKGPGADVSGRVKWPSIKKINPAEAGEFTPKNFLRGDDWIAPTGVPYVNGTIPSKPSTTVATTNAGSAPNGVAPTSSKTAKTTTTTV